MKAQAPTLELPGVKAWAAWLKAHHASSDAVFLRIEKKSESTLTYATALEAALWPKGHADWPLVPRG